MSNFKKEVLGDNVLCEVLHLVENEGGVIDMSKAEKRVNRFSEIIGIGPDVKDLKLGDTILIPEKEAGRILFPLEGREFACFPESGVRIKAKQLY